MRRRLRYVARTSFGLTVLGMAAAGWLTSAAGGGLAIVAAVVTFVLATAVTGVVLATRRPDHPIGWLLLGSGFAYATGSVAVTFVEAAIARPGTLPLMPLVVWAGDIAFGVGSVTCATWVLLLFPTGRLPSARWRPAAWLPGAALALALTDVVFGAAAFAGTGLDNPVQLEADGVVAILSSGGLVLLAASTLLSAASLIVRYRHAAGVERLQLRWVAFSAAGAGGTLALTAVWEMLSGASRPTEDAVNLVMTAALSLVPVTIGVAILRYRLYEIDRIISRTVTYALVTAVIGGIYVLVAVVPSAMLELDSDLLVAVATLTAAAVAVPARRRLQRVVDRRFNRARYDAQRVVDGFAAQLRGALDLDDLTDDLAAVVAVTVQPAGVAVWVAGRRS